MTQVTHDFGTVRHSRHRWRTIVIWRRSAVRLCLMSIPTVRSIGANRASSSERVLGVVILIVGPRTSSSSLAVPTHSSCRTNARTARASTSCSRMTSIAA
jgi:hypothetical protein